MTTDWVKQTVETFLFEDPMKPCSKSLLHDMAKEEPYWYKANKFVKENSHFQLLHLSPAQMSWLYKIQDGLLEEARRTEGT